MCTGAGIRASADISVMVYVDESQCADTVARSRKTTEASSCQLRQVDVPGCISYDTFYRALQFTYCGEVNPSSPVLNSPDPSQEVLVNSSLLY